VRTSFNRPLYMKFLLLSLITLGSTLEAAEVTVRLDNPPSNGNIVFMFFDSADSFSDFRDPERVVKQPLDAREIYRIPNLSSREYALLVYYDENNNDRLDRNFIGIPKEPLWFSNRYEPKGPPSYNRAVFFLAEGESRHFDVKLRRLLGKRGRIGAGIGVIAQTSPYRDYDGGVYRTIPAIVYNGERFQIYGPNAQMSLAGSGKLRLAATGRYRIGAYEEDGSDFLSGMGDRKSTLMAGMALTAELPKGVDLSMSYSHDVLGEIGGGEMGITLDRSFPVGPCRLSPKVGLHWLSSKLADHDFGVPPSKATPNRPAYSLGSAISGEIGLGFFMEITQDWLVVLNMTLELLDRDVVDSPIVSEDYRLQGFSAISYVF